MSITIDTHHHVIPDFYWEASNEGGEAAGGITPPRWSLEGAIAYLDEAEIDAAVVSFSTPGVDFGDPGAARVLACQCNEFLGELVYKRPKPLCASCRGSLRRDASGTERRGLPCHAISDVSLFRRAGQAIKEWS